MVKIIIKNGVCLALLACMPVLQVQAEIYKCVNKQGKTFYNDKSCPVYDQETQIKAVKDPKNGYMPPVFEKDKQGESKSFVIGGDTSKGVKQPADKKESPKDENTNLLKSSNSKMSGSPPHVAPISDSGRVLSSSSAENNKSGKSPKNPDVSVLQPRVELKVERREY